MYCCPYCGGKMNFTYSIDDTGAHVCVECGYIKFDIEDEG